MKKSIPTRSGTARYVISYADPAINNGYNTQNVYLAEYKDVRRVIRHLKKENITYQVQRIK